MVYRAQYALSFASRQPSCFCLVTIVVGKNLGLTCLVKGDDIKWLVGRAVNSWQYDSLVPFLAGAELKLRRALGYNDNNFTALYRLGLIALARQDFATAVNLLTQAQALNSQYRGIQKAVGYCALWNGDLEKAENLPAALPEKYQLPKHK